ncbi:MAG: RsmD family RNA methyltransferase, partial [Candidatus Levyibacteriota bacterium]
MPPCMDGTPENWNSTGASPVGRTRSFACRPCPCFRSSAPRSAPLRSAPPSASRPRPPVPAPNRVRIIGGRHRGRQIRVPDVPGLRPTPDRVRETL